MTQGADRPSVAPQGAKVAAAERRSVPAAEREARRRVIAIQLTVAGFFLVVLIGVFAIGVLGIGPYGHGHL